VWSAGIGACSGALTSGTSRTTPASASARVAGSLKPSTFFGGFKCVIHTAPSTVARQNAPCRVATISPGTPRSVRSACAPNRWKSIPAT
jgi:hypothetical protein